MVFLAKHFHSLVAFRQTKFKWVIFVILAVMSTRSEVSVENVATSEQFPVLSYDYYEVLSCCDVNHLVAIVDSEEVARNFMHMIYVSISSHT